MWSCSLGTRVETHTHTHTAHTHTHPRSHTLHSTPLHSTPWVKTSAAPSSAKEEDLLCSYDRPPGIRRNQVKSMSMPSPKIGGGGGEREKDINMLSKPLPLFSMIIWLLSLVILPVIFHSRLTKFELRIRLCTWPPSMVVPMCLGSREKLRKGT